MASREIPTFKGYDLTELFPVFGLIYPENSDGEVEFAMMAAFLKTLVDREMYSDFPDQPNEWEYRVMCAYLQALIDTGYSNYEEIYAGMLKMQDRHAFFKACMYLVHTMWT